MSIEIELPPELRIKKSNPIPITAPPVRASSMGVLDTCKRKFFYALRLNLRPKKSLPSSALLSGGYFHQFMEFGHQCADEVHAQFEIAKNVALTVIEDEGDLDGSLQSMLVSTERDFLKAEVMARIFWDKYPAQDNNLTVIAQELELAHRITVTDGQQTTKVALEGRVDRIIQDSSKKYWIQDYKTTSFTPQAVASSYPWSDACRIYRILGINWLKKNELIQNSSELAGFQLNIIRKPTIRFSPTRLDSNKKGLFPSQFHSYLDRCEKWYAEQEKKDETERVCRQFSLRFDGPILPPEFKTRLTDASYLSTCMSGPSDTEHITPQVVEKLFPRRAWSCYDPYGRPCSFLPLCRSNWENLDNNVEAGYTIEPPQEKEVEGDSYD